MTLFRWIGQPAAGLTFEQFREKTGFDKNSTLQTAPIHETPDSALIRGPPH